MWFRFEKGNPVGIPRIKQYQVCSYDMHLFDGDCHDESWWKPDDIDRVITYVETVEDKNNSTRFRVFAIFDDGDEYELKLEKISKKERKYLSNFYGAAKLSKWTQFKRWYYKKKQSIKYRIERLKRRW